MLNVSSSGATSGMAEDGDVSWPLDDDPVSTDVDELAYGEVFTRRWVVETLLDLIGYTPERRLADEVIVEPAVGSGAFLVPIVERLLEAAAKQGVHPSTLGSAIRAYDLQPAHVATCRSLVRQALANAGVEAARAEEIAREWVTVADFLLDDVVEAADYVVGNPPYIRSDDMTDEQQAAYRKRWSTMRGRVDIYVGFFERGLGLLKPDAKLGFICADRWMRNAYGANLREFVGDKYSVESLWQMHDVDAFEEQVSAYPAITVISNRPQASVVVIDTNATFGAAESAEAVGFAASDDTVLTTSAFTGHRMHSWFRGPDLWPTGAPDRIALLEDLNERFAPLENRAEGTKIGIGVATGADAAYIVASTVDVEDDRKLPIVVADDIRPGVFTWGGRVLLNPWNADGTIVELSAYPKFRAALESHPTLKARYVAKKNPATWHRTIDKVDARLTDRPKLLLQDMKASIQPVFEPGGFYPHHNLYYIVSDVWDLEVLGGLLLSRVVQTFIEAYGVRMRGGTLRFQAQYLRKIRVPDPRTMPEDVARRLAEAFKLRDVDAATRAAEAAYGLPEGTL